MSHRKEKPTHRLRRQDVKKKNYLIKTRNFEPKTASFPSHMAGACLSLRKNYIPSAFFLLLLFYGKITFRARFSVRVSLLLLFF